jgi:uridine kinase
MFSPINDKTFRTNDIAFKTQFTINITGPSKCGKTSLASDF